jgi:hypothetical protein
MITVDINGGGNYTSITAAVNSIAAGGEGTIFVMPGVYDNQEVNCFGKTVHLIGASKQACIIKNHTGSYYTPPVRIGAGTLRNLTIIAENNPTYQGLKAYAVHVEDNYLFGRNLLVDNVCAIGTQNNSFGVGLRGGSCIEFINSSLMSYGGHAGIFFHDAPTAQYSGVQNISFNNCDILSDTGVYGIMRMNSQEIQGATINVEFVRCLIRSLANIASTLVGKANVLGGTYPSNWMGLGNYVLSRASWGNNFADYDAQ